MWFFREVWEPGVPRAGVLVAMAAAIGLLTCGLASGDAWAQCGGGGCGSGSSCGSSSSGGSDYSSHAGPADMSDYSPSAGGTLVRRPREAPHGGQVTATEWHYFEVVYAPRETRIYVYSPSMQRMDAHEIRGEVTLQVRGNPHLYRYAPLEASDGPGMRYLSVPVDVRQIRDDDMLVNFVLENLPFREEPRVQFTQVFALTHGPGMVAPAAMVP